MACKIIRNEDGTVDRVLADNNERSILYNQIRETTTEEQALLDYSGTFTEEFKNVIESFKNSEDSTNIYDENGEVQYYIYDYIMHPEKFFGQNNVVNTKFQKDRNNNLRIAGLSYLVGTLEMLSVKFGLSYEVIFDESNPNKGYIDVISYGKPTIIINASKASHDTPLHEYGHIFINLIKLSNKNLYSNLVKEILNTEIGKKELSDVKNYYSNYTLEEQIEETIVELLGRYARNEFDPESGIHKTIKKIWNTILEFLSKTFNVEIKDISPNMSIEQLSKLLSNPNVNFNQKSFIEQNLETIKNTNIKNKERLENEYTDFKKINNPSLIRENGYTLIINKNEFDIFKKEIETTINSIKEYSKSQLLIDINNIKSEITTFQERNNFDYSRYPMFTKILKFFHPTPNTALYVLDREIQNGNLDNEIKDNLKFLDKSLTEITQDVLSGYMISDQLGIKIPDFYKMSSYTFSSFNSVEEIENSFIDKLSELNKIIQNPEKSDSYYDRSFKFSTETDTYKVYGKFKDGNISISFSSDKYGMKDVNNSLFFKILPKVIDSISYMFSDLEYNTISFTPVSGESSKGRDLRLKGYNIFAKRLFGQFSLVAENDNTTIIPIPEMFKNQIHIKENMYQKDRTDIPVIQSAQFNQIQNDTNENIAVEVLNKIANRISKNLNGVPYNSIEEADAVSLLASTKEKYTGQPAFFYNGQVYFIKDKLNLENLFHEFSHPFIKAIKKTNPGLFNKLYDNLIQTEEGQKLKDLVKEYYNHDENSEEFKEEMLVRALTTRARNNELKVQESSGFDKLMNQLWYAVKQIIRKIFGKVKIDKLNENTTLDELVKMLNNESFEISAKDITDSERADFNNLKKESVKELISKANATLVQSNIDKLFKLIRSGQQVLEQGETNYPGLEESISKEKLDSPFQEEYNAISRYQTYTKTNEEPLDLVNYREKQIEGLVLSIEAYNDSIEKIILEINRLKSDPNSIVTISKNMYFLKILKQTLQTFVELRQEMTDAGVNVASPIFQLLTKATINAESGIRIIYEENKKALPLVLAPHLKGINEVLIKEFNKVIEEMVARGSSREAIAAKERERDSYLRDENTLAKVMVGETPEPAGLGLSTLVESAVSSPDELISSFALYVKEALIDVELNATANFNDFLADTRKLLKDAGLDDFKLVSKLGKIITFKEELGYTDPKTGEFKTHEVHTFLNKFKGYELVLSKFKYDINKALENGDSELAASLEMDREEWKRTYMHDKWKPEVYKIYDVFKKTYVNSAGVTVEIGKMAKERYNKIMDNINNGIKLIDDELERVEIQNRMKIDTLWVDYKKLFSKYDDDGLLKTGDEMAITETLLEYRAQRKEYFEWESDESPDSMPILRFKKARSLFIDQLLTKFERSDLEFAQKLQEWDDMNTRKVIDKQFYVDKALILEKINEIYNSLSGSFAEDSKIVKETKEYWDLIINQLYAYRDEENHPNGLLVSKEKIAEIKKAQEKIQELQDMIKNGNGLSRAETREYRRLDELVKRGIELSAKDYSDYENLEIRSNFSSIPKGVKSDLKKLYADLENLQSKKATDYYLEVYNYQIDLHNRRQEAKGLPVTVKHFDRFAIDYDALDRGFVESVFKKDPEFKKWFMANHVEVERWDDELQMRVIRFERLFLWNQIEPRDSKYKKRVQWRDETGRDIFVWGLPSLSYYKQNIKPEYATEEIVGETVDNRGNYLPRENVVNSPYINQAYFDLKRDNIGAFNLLEKIKEYHIKFQEKADKSDRLWMQVPRYEKTSKELTETNKFFSDKTSTAKAALKNFLNKFKVNAEDTDEGLGVEDKFKLTRLDFFNDDEQKIHISGKPLIDEDQVSLDVITSVLRHMHSVERAHKLAEIEPIAKALMELMNDPKNQPKDITKASMYHWITQKIPIFANKKGENIRAKAIKGLIDRTFYNVQQTGFGSDAIVLQKLSKVMMKAASFGFFALDIPSAVKNRFGQQLQQAIELAAGTSYDGKSFLKGKIIASKAMLEISGSIYSKGKLPYYAQLVNAFDPSQGMAMDKLPLYITRTIYKDVASPGNILMSPRKFLEIEGTLEFFFGVMEFTKVDQTINGVTTQIPYHEAFELVNDRLKLREGIDEKWDLGGSEFKRKRIFIQEKQNILNGVYSKFDQPEGNRYLFYRMFMFLRKFFITGMVNRFGFSGSLFAPRFRRNNASQTLEMGYWIQSARALAKLLVTTGKHWHFMRPSEKGAVYKALTEMALLTILSALIPMLFGWDGDDDDKYEKLRKRQGGPLGSDDFEMGGWLANHLLYQTMSVASENMQYYKVGFYSDMLSNFNLANGPSLQTYGKILGDIINMVTDDDAAYYKKDVGPYSWQKAESAKILNHVAKMFSLTGKTLDPSKAIQDFKSAENIYK